MDLEFIRDSYQKMSDDELIRIATTDANGLTEEAKEIKKEQQYHSSCVLRQCQKV